MGKLHICLEDTLYMSIVIINERIRPTVCIRVSSRDYSAGNNRDTPFRAGLINQIQAGRETFPRYQRIRAYPSPREVGPSGLCIYAGDDTRTRLGIPHGTQATLD